MKNLRNLLVAGAAIAAAGASAWAGPVIDLTFAGVAPYPSASNVQILNYYNGGTSSIGTSGPNFGVYFSPNALALCLNDLAVTCSNTSKGGLGDPNSQENALYWLSNSDAFLDDPAGFTTGFSFTYTDPFTPGASVSVFSGLDGTGALLATIPLGLTPDAGCPGYPGQYCPFEPVGVVFAGTAESIDFAGTADFVVYDDVTFGSSTPGNPTPEPSSLMLLGTGMAGFAGLLRRKFNLRKPSMFKLN